MLFILFLNRGQFTWSLEVPYDIYKKLLEKWREPNIDFGAKSLFTIDAADDKQIDHISLRLSQNSFNTRRLAMCPLYGMLFGSDRFLDSAVYHFASRSCFTVVFISIRFVFRDYLNIVLTKSMGKGQICK